MLMFGSIAARVGSFLDVGEVILPATVFHLAGISCFKTQFMRFEIHITFIPDPLLLDENAKSAL